MKKATLLTLTMRVLLLFPIFTLLDFIPKINTVLVVLSVVLVAVAVLKKGVTGKSFFLLIAALVSTALNLYITDGSILNINEVIYLGFMCVFFVLLTDEKRQIEQYFIEDTVYIRGICILWSLLVVVSLPFKSSYADGVFISFAGNTFRLSPSALFVMVLSTVLIVTKGKGNIVYSLVPIIAILLGASRTYLLLGCLCLTINLYFFSANRTNFFVLMSVMAIVCLIVIFASSMGQKIQDSFADNPYLDPLAVFTSGRSNFWAKDWAAYLQQPVFNKLLGSGYNFVRNVNGAYLGDSEGIWAHNDFLQLIITNGVFGLGIYLYVIRGMFRLCADRVMPRMMRFALVLIWLFNAFFNMYYVYICAMLSWPILLLACKRGYNVRKLQT